MTLTCSVTEDGNTQYETKTRETTEVTGESALTTCFTVDGNGQLILPSSQVYNSKTGDMTQTPYDAIHMTIRMAETIQDLLSLQPQEPLPTADPNNRSE